jgi:hypothetical protein
MKCTTVEKGILML